MAEGEVETTSRRRGARIRARAVRRRSGTVHPGKGMLPLPGAGSAGSQRLARLRSSTKALSFERTTSLR